MISHPFCIDFVQVNPVIVEYTLCLQKFLNTPHIVQYPMILYAEVKSPDQT